MKRLFIIFIAFAAIAHGQQAPILLRQAGHCLAHYGFEPLADASHAHSAGYLFDTKTWPDDKYLVVVIYTDQNRRKGFVYGFSVEENAGQRVLHLDNNGQFDRSTKDTHWEGDLLGGVWTHEYFQRAIARIGSRPASLLLPKELRATMPSVSCTSYADQASK